MKINLKDVKSVCQPLMHYCQKVIPLAYDESLSYYEQLCNIVSYLKDTIYPALNNNADALTELQNAFTLLQNYVNDYFDNLDIQEEVNNKLDELIDAGAIQLELGYTYDAENESLTLYGIINHNSEV